MWPMSLLFIKTSQVKQYLYQNYFSGVFDALHQRFLAISGPGLKPCFIVIKLIFDHLYTKPKKKRRYRIFHFNVFFQKRIKIRKLETKLIENVIFAIF